MKNLKTSVLLMLIFLGCNYVMAQEESKAPRPDYIDWPCFYIEGSPETWNLERHVNPFAVAVSGKNTLKFEQVFTTSNINKGGMYVLEGASSGVVIKSSDTYAFVVRKKIEHSLDSITRAVSKQYNQYDSKKEEEILAQYKLKLYKVKTEKGQRKFYLNDTQIPCTAEQLPNNTDRIIPVDKLKPGEYAILYKTTNVFTFKIE